MLVAALFVMPDSVYKTMPGVDCWDEERDARNWPGGCTVVAHPPCRTWGVLKAFATAAPPHEHAMGIWAINQVRRWGGVLEHPLGSTLFRETGCGKPWGLPDEHGGQLIQVDQFHWGHRARKRTLLYIVGAQSLPPIPFRQGEPEAVLDRPGSARKKDRPNTAGRKPWVTHRERSATPPALAEWLVSLARSCKVTP